MRPYSVVLIHKTVCILVSGYFLSHVLMCLLQLEKRDKAAAEGTSAGFTKNKVRLNLTTSLLFLYKSADVTADEVT